MKYSVIETANYPRSLTRDVSNGLHARTGKKEHMDPILACGAGRQQWNRTNSAHKKGSSRNPGKDRNKNADLMDDVRASKHIYKPAFLCTILIRFCPFGRAFLWSPSGLMAMTC